MGNSTRHSECPLRHENGNCLPHGGFCTAVNENVCEAMYQAYDAGRRAEAQQWIPFDEQRPEYRQGILVTIHWHESGEEEYFVQFDTYVDDATLNSNFKIDRDAFAWMPLPEPFREEGGE